MFDKIWFNLYWQQGRLRTRGQVLVKESTLNIGEAFGILTQRFHYSDEAATQLLNEAKEKLNNNGR